MATTEEATHHPSSQWTRVQDDSCLEGNRVSDIRVEEGNNYVYHGPQVEYEEVISPVYQIRTHTGKRPFVCDSCNTTVTPNSHHLNHIHILGGGKPIVRHVYYMNFTRRSLSPVKGRPEKPKKKSKSKKTYHCDKCERIFGHKSHFVNHQRTHSGEKPFVCTHCNKTFGQKSNLTAHIRRHLGNGKLCNNKKSNDPDESKDDLEVKEDPATTSSSPSSSVVTIKKKKKPLLKEEKPQSGDDVVPKTPSFSVHIKSEPQSLETSRYVRQETVSSAPKVPVIRMEEEEEETERDSASDIPLIHLKIEKYS